MKYLYSVILLTFISGCIGTQAPLYRYHYQITFQDGTSNDISIIAHYVSLNDTCITNDQFETVVKFSPHDFVILKNKELITNE